MGIPIETITTDVINAIKNNPSIIFYQAGNTSYVVWNVVLEVGCLKPIFDRWMSKAPWTALLESFQRLNNLTGSNQRLTFGNIRVYLKYAISIPPNLRSTITLFPDMISYGIQIKNVNQIIIDAVRNTQNLELYVSGDSFYLTHRVMIITGVLKPIMDGWFLNIDSISLVNEINHVLTTAGRKNINLSNLKLYGKYQLSYPYALKIQHYARN